MDDRLLAVAYGLCIEMRQDAHWGDAMYRVRDREGTAETRRQGPGYSVGKYAHAIAQGMMNSR